MSGAIDPSATRTARRVEASNQIANALCALADDGFLPFSVRYSIADRALDEAQAWLDGRPGVSL